MPTALRTVSSKSSLLALVPQCRFEQSFPKLAKFIKVQWVLDPIQLQWDNKIEFKKIYFVLGSSLRVSMRMRSPNK